MGPTRPAITCRIDPNVQNAINQLERIANALEALVLFSEDAKDKLPYVWDEGKLGQELQEREERSSTGTK